MRRAGRFLPTRGHPTFRAPRPPCGAFLAPPAGALVGYHPLLPNAGLPRALQSSGVLRAESQAWNSFPRANVYGGAGGSAAGGDTEASPRAASAPTLSQAVSLWKPVETIFAFQGDLGLFFLVRPQFAANRQLGEFLTRVQVCRCGQACLLEQQPAL